MNQRLNVVVTACILPESHHAVIYFLNKLRKWSFFHTFQKNSHLPDLLQSSGTTGLVKDFVHEIIAGCLGRRLKGNEVEETESILVTCTEKPHIEFEVFHGWV